jgi:hypothetical protein
MKTRIVFIILLFCFAESGNRISAQTADSVMWWSNYNAIIQQKGHLSFGLVQALRYGLSNRIELSGSALIFPLDPNIKLKYNFHLKSKLIICSEHNIHFPTPFLRLLSAEGIGGVISPQYKMPVMGSLYNGIILSYLFKGNYLFTYHGGFGFALRSGDPDPGSTIDLPFVFPRLSVYYNDVLLETGLNLDKKITENIYFLTRNEFFIVPGSENNLFFEHRGILRWKSNRRFFMQGGYTLCYGKYPFGIQWHLLPNLDLGFRF